MKIKKNKDTFSCYINEIIKWHFVGKKINLKCKIICLASVPVVVDLPRYLLATIYLMKIKTKKY